MRGIARGVVLGDCAVATEVSGSKSISENSVNLSSDFIGCFLEIKSGGEKRGVVSLISKRCGVGKTGLA